MHQIQATVPLEHAREAARLAHNVGIERVSITDVYIDGPDCQRQLLSVETSTPKARLFIDALLNSASLAETDYSLTSRELRAVVTRADLAELTDPMSEPFPDVIQDLWQLSSVTASYTARALAGGILLATGLMDDNAVAIVAAALFLPFLPEVLALGFGMWSRDRRLIGRGLRAIAASTLLAFAAGVIVASFMGGPIRYHGFKGTMISVALSGVIGITAGLSNADDTGRRYLIGVAAAVQLAIYPAWLGAACIAGFPAREVMDERLLTFALNLITIAVTALLAYAALDLRRSGGRAPRSSR